MKKIVTLIAVLFTTIALTSCTLLASLFMSFDDLANQLFLSYLGDDLYAWNLLTINSSDFGFERTSDIKAEWYSYSELSAEEVSGAYSSFNSIKSLLGRYNEDDLSEGQKITYNSIKYFLDFYCDFYNPENGCDRLLDLNYIDSYGGYVANFGSVVESYKFRNETDIKDLIDYITSTKDAFPTYYTYVNARRIKGYSLTEATVKNMLSYLARIKDKGQNYYLYDILDKKIGAVDFIEQSKINEYKDLAKNAMNNYFFSGVNTLYDSLSSYTDFASTNSYYASYGYVGTNQYEIELEQLLGFLDLNMNSYANYLKDKLDEYSLSINTILNQYKDNESFKAYMNGTSTLTNLTNPTEMLEYLKEFSKTIVRDLNTTPDISVSYLDDTVASNTNVVAYYTKSALDNTTNEYITLNPNYLSDDYTETLITLSHEGYPGHLYDYNYSKQLDISNFAKINSNVGRGEGWAVYVEYKLYEYLGEQIGTPEAKAYAMYEAYTMLLGYTFQTYADYLITFKSYKVNDVSTLLASYGLNAGAAETIYNRLIEMPTEYASYGFGSCYMLDLHEKAKEALGNNYNEIEINTEILNLGWSSFQYLTQRLNLYVVAKGGILDSIYL